MDHQLGILVEFISTIEKVVWHKKRGGPPPRKLQNIFSKLLPDALDAEGLVELEDLGGADGVGAADGKEAKEVVDGRTLVATVGKLGASHPGARLSALPSALVVLLRLTGPIIVL